MRIANISSAGLAGATPPDLITLMVKAYNRLGDYKRLGRCVIYCNETVATYLDIQAMNKSNVWLAMREYDGHDVLTFRGIPIRRVDALTSTEAVVS